MRTIISLLLLVTMSLYPAPLFAGVRSPQENAPPTKSWKGLTNMSYVELYQKAPKLNIPEQTIESYLKYLDEQKHQEKEQLKNTKQRLKDRIDQAQESLQDLNDGDVDSVSVEEQRHSLHCQIQSSRKDLRETQLALDTGLDNKYDNYQAKLKIVRDWPARYQELQRMIANDEPSDRKFSDYQDIGFRGGPFEGQEKDVKKGRQAIDELKRQNVLPPEIEDEAVVSYIQNLGYRIARHSDLRVPLKVTVLRSEEINAFSLPGGFLFVNSGLIEQTDNEAQLAGVMAHEIAHAAARHGDRLMGKANIANIIFQAAQIAALVLTGGVSSIATYYLLQYGFMGLGLILNLSLLGVSRDYEIEADILGTQYLWASNIDTTGFVSFFGKMAEKQGYVTGLSWFRTHPPFAKRMQRTYEELVYLPKQDDPTVTSSKYREMKDHLTKLLKEMKDKDRAAPTLRRVFDCGEAMP